MTKKVCLGGVRVVHVSHVLHVFTFPVPYCDVRYNFRVRNVVRLVFIPSPHNEEEAGVPERTTDHGQVTF